MRYIVPVVAVLTLASPAAAQSVDATGASQLTEDLKRYLGQTAFEKGIVAVALDGDAYKITFAINALSTILPENAKATLNFDSYEIRVKPRSDGSWDVAGPLLPNGSAAFETPQGPQSMAWTSTDGLFTGVYDPALGSFTTAEGSVSKITSLSTEPLTNSEAAFGAGKFTMSGKPGANGGVDFDTQQSFADFSQTVTITDPSAPMKFTMASPQVKAVSTGSGLRSKPLLDLGAFLVANSDDEAKIKANQAELKDRLLAILPVWNRIDGSYGLTDLNVGTPFGQFTAKDAGVSVAMDGISTNGSLNYGMKFAGLTVPAGLLPEWSAKILPTEIDLNFGGANLDLDTMVRAAIEAFDLNNNPPIPDDVAAKIGMDFLAKEPKFVINQSIVKNAETQFAFSGDAVMRGEKPDVNLTIDATGYDAMVAHVQTAAASDPQAQQAYPALLAGKGFAKTMPDGSLQWVVNIKPDGSILVNGGMIKGPDAVEAPAPIDPNAPPGTLTSPPAAETPAPNPAPAPVDPNAPPGTLTSPQ